MTPRSDLRRPMKKIGLIVNPIAGMGGRVGLKGTDGKAYEEAVRLGAQPVAPSRVAETLRALEPNMFQLITYPRSMGEEAAARAGYKPKVIGHLSAERTSAEDTKRAAREMMDMGVNLILFAGGDGTARDLCESLQAKVPVLGIPAGVKLHSAVFAVTPTAAAQLVKKFLQGEAGLLEAEVMDVDEEAFRQGRVSTRLHGYLTVPHKRQLLQAVKEGSLATEDEREDQRAIARHVVEEMEGELAHVLGPGTTLRPIAEALGFEKTLLGVDVANKKGLIAKDVNEADILKILENKRAKIVVTPIGGQGYIFGRGNQQISPAVIRKVGRDNIIVISTKQKLATLQNRLLVDTGDESVDKELRGFMKVVVDYREERAVRVD